MTPERALDAFEDAAAEIAFIGEIPAFGGDPEEQVAIDREIRRRRANYSKARNRLLRMLKP